MPQVLLLNVFIVAIALVIYDQLRDDAAPRTQRAAPARAEASADVERRLRLLEANQGAPRTDPSILERLAALESAAKRAPAASAPAPAPDEGKAIDRGKASLSKDEVQRFRKLQDAADRERMLEKNRARVDRALKKASVNLSEEQRKKVHAAHAAFRPRVDEIWGEIKTQANEDAEAGVEVDGEQLWRDGLTRIRTEFAATLTGIVPHQADADAIATALMGAGK